MFTRKNGAAINGGRIADFLAAFNYGLRNQQLIEDPVSGRIDALFYNCRLTSVFQPIVHSVSGRPVGHRGFLRAAGADGVSLSPWGMFSFAVADHELVDLDRLCRTLHVLNYYRTVSARHTLYLNVQLRLLVAVGRDFGRAFGNRLDRLGLAPGQVAIVLPPDLIAHPALFAAAVTDYQEQGYRVVANYPANPLRWPRAYGVQADVIHVDSAELVDADAWSHTRQAIHALGALASAGRVAARQQATLARESGFDLVQGYELGRPDAEVFPNGRSGADPVALETLSLW